MNRRSFLKAVGVAIVAPVVVCSSSPKKRPVEVYGRGPGIEAISDVRRLNEINSSLLDPTADYCKAMAKKVKDGKDDIIIGMFT